MTTSTALETRPAPVRPEEKRSKLWLWFVLAFVLQFGAWVAWFTIATQHKVQEVPLATAR